MKRRDSHNDARAIEVRASAMQPLGMPPARFLRDYWQKRPLLIRGGFPNFHKCISPEDLAGLACEETALSRIVLHDAKRDCWTLRNGPFAETDFAKLPKTQWTLLVQDVDKWDMDVAALLDRFEFIPSWRVDDVMISYATDGGGVGPHVDNYDVFLVQGLGQRRWRISDDPRSPKDFRADAELTLLRDFVPTHDWILESGDALYLPPGVAHDGVAVGSCMTFSVGMRAPSQAELLLDFAESLAESLGEDRRYSDPELRPANDSGEIDDAALARVRAAMPQFAEIGRSTLTRWFGCFITRYRAAHEAMPAARPLSATQVAEKLPRAHLLRNPWSRFAWTRRGRLAQLFVAGQSYVCPIVLARALCGSRDLDGAAIAPLCASPPTLETLAALINGGHLQISKRK
jgi:50S ribosomal protein L16 3-hydroxylase